MHRWGSGVDDESTVGGEGLTAVACRECEGGVVACGVLDGGAVEGEGGGGFVVEVGGGISVLNGVGEREGAGAGAGGIGSVLIGGSGLEGELGRTTSGVNGDGF